MMKSKYHGCLQLCRQKEKDDEFFEYTWSRLGDLLSSIHVLTELFVERSSFLLKVLLEIQRRLTVIRQQGE